MRIYNRQLAYNWSLSCKLNFKMDILGINTNDFSVSEVNTFEHLLGSKRTIFEYNQVFS